MDSPARPDDTRTPETPDGLAHSRRHTDIPPDPATHRRAMLAGIGGLAAGAFLTSKAHAGPLNPPPGPIAATGKTTQEIFDKISSAEPRIPISAATTPGNATSTFRIAQGGSYYLTGNIIGEAGKHGIDIAVTNVTLDLNGFSIIGVGGSLHGVRLSAFAGRNIVVRNGTVRGFGATGVFCESNNGQPPELAVERIRAMDNGADGIEGKFGAQIIDCVASSNAARGIVGGSIVRIIGCQTQFNGGIGINSGQAAAVIGCVSTGNSGAGIAASQGSLVTDCNVSFNNGGITATGAVIESCTIHFNSGDGVSAFAACTISHCTLYRNSGNGISATNCTNVIGCSAYENDGNGVSVGSGSTVQACSARLNGGNGILATNASLLTGNQCSSNGQAGSSAGLAVSGTDNRIEGNNCTGQTFGFNIIGAGNIITRNTASGNSTNWLMVANNYYGPIISIAGTSTPTVVGSSASSTLGTTNAHANFTF